MWSNKWNNKRTRSKRSNKKRTNKARDFSTWSNLRVNQVLIIVGCSLLVGLVGYRIGYRSGISRPKRAATTTAPLSMYTATTEHLETENESGKIVRDSTVLTEEPETQQADTSTATHLATENENGKMVRTSTDLSEEFGTQQIFSSIVPYIKRTFYVE